MATETGCRRRYDSKFATWSRLLLLLLLLLIVVPRDISRPGCLPATVRTLNFRTQPLGPHLGGLQHESVPFPILYMDYTQPRSFEESCLEHRGS
jgi:hypothetical protein